MTSYRIDWICKEHELGRTLTRKEFESLQSKEEAEKKKMDGVRKHLEDLRISYKNGEIGLIGSDKNGLYELGLDQVDIRSSLNFDLNIDIASITELFGQLIGHIQKLSYRSLKNPNNVDVKILSGSSLDFLVQDIQDIISLFVKNQIDLTGVPLLRLWQHDLQYWQDFFANTKFKDFFADTPWIIKHACISYRDPESFLRSVIANYEKIIEMEEFREFFAESLGVIKHVCVRHPKNPEGFLRGAMAKYQKIIEMQEFREFFADSTSDIKNTCVSYGNPEAYLRSAMANYQKIIEMGEFKEFFASTPSIIKEACVSHRDPESFLRIVMTNYQKIIEMEEFREFLAGTHWIIKYVCVRHPRNPEGFLRGAMANYQSIIGMEEIKVFFLDNPSIIKEACVNHRNPEAFLRKIMAKNRGGSNTPQ